MPTDRHPPIHQAAAAGDLERLQELLDAGVPVDFPGWMGDTPLHAAASAGQVEAARLLIERGAAVNSRRDSGDTPLHWAASGPVAELLLTGGADLEAANEFGGTPLHRAAQFGCEEVVARLLQRGAAAEARSRWGECPLHMAAAEGHLACVRLLVEAGAEIDLPDTRLGRTPLHYAAFRGQTEVVEYLVAAGARRQPRDHAGQTPFHCARDNHHPETAERLRRAGGADSEPLAGPLVATRVVAHPSWPEAVTVLEHAALGRWQRGDPPQLRATAVTSHSRIADLAVAPDGELLALAVPEPELELRRWDDLERAGSLPWPGSSAAGPRAESSAVAFSPDGRWLAVADGSDEHVHLIERATGRRTDRFEGGEWNSQLIIDPASRLLATVCLAQGEARVRIDALKGNGRRRGLHEELASFPGGLPRVAFSPDGERLAILAVREDADAGSGPPAELSLFSVIDGQRRWSVPLEGLPGVGAGDERADARQRGCCDVAFSSPEEVVVGPTRGGLRLHNVRDGHLTRRLELPGGSVARAFAVSATGSFIWVVLGSGALITVPV
jgi:ankyrin repeat protein